MRAPSGAGALGTRGAATLLVAGVAAAGVLAVGAGVDLLAHTRKKVLRGPVRMLVDQALPPTGCRSKEPISTGSRSVVAEAPVDAEAARQAALRGLGVAPPPMATIRPRDAP